MKIITISGLDGSGKSTQISLIKDFLENQGRKVFYFHAGNYSISKTYNILRPHKIIAKKHKESVTSASWLQIQLRKFALLVDMKRFRMLARKLKKENFDYILSDRYFFDSVINLAYLSKKDPSSWQPKVFLKQGLAGLIPDCAFYLEAEPEIIMQRERQPDQGLDYLQRKKELYEKAAPVWNLKVINGNRSKEEIFEEIKNTIAN